MEREQRFSLADRVIWVGFIVNALLMVMKLAAGYYGHSEAVLADGVESGCDLLVTMTALIALYVGRQPFDAEHPYGHGRAENICALLVALAILASGAIILVGAAHTILTHEYQTPKALAIGAALGTIVIKEWLYRISRKVGEKLQSPTVLAMAKDHRKDALTTIATLIGVTGGFLGAGFLDPLAAAITSIIIFHIGYTTFKTAVYDLMDGMPSRDLISEISIMASGVQGVEAVHEIRARRSGQYLVVDLKLDMDQEMTVKRSHDIATEVKQKIFQQFPDVGDVMIHVNPHQEEHEDLIRL